MSARPPSYAVEIPPKLLCSKCFAQQFENVRYEPISSFQSDGRLGMPQSTSLSVPVQPHGLVTVYVEPSKSLSSYSMAIRTSAATASTTPSFFGLEAFQPRREARILYRLSAVERGVVT
jgi:hypothetical protein